MPLRCCFLVKIVIVSTNIFYAEVIIIDNRALIETCNPLEYLECLIAFDPRDWGEYNRDAIVFAVVLGWDDAAYAELQAKFKWRDSFVELLKAQHREWEHIRSSCIAASANKERSTS